MEDEYKKSKNNTGIEGTKFQLNLLTVFLLNALNTCKRWRISTENEEAGKYDDIVLELPDRSVLLQAKYKKNKKLTKEQIFSTTKNAHFGLAKYFFSYHEIKTKFASKTLIICTNTGVCDKSLNNVLIGSHIDHESMLHYKQATYSVFTVNANILPDLERNIRDYYKKNLEGTGTDKTIITEENIKEFLKNLHFISNYPNGENLEKVIEQLLSGLNSISLYNRVSFQEIYKKIEDWFRESKGKYLTEIHSKAMFSEIKSDKYCKKLKNYGVSFDRNSFNFTDAKQVFQIKFEGSYLLQALKIYDALQINSSKTLYVDPNAEVEVQKEMIDAFKLPRYTFLILILNKITETAIKEIGDKLRDALEKDYKKVILVTGIKNHVLQQIELKDIFQADGLVRFEDLSEDTQKTLVSKRIINFQGVSCSLEKLLVASPPIEFSKAIDCEILENLITGREIRVGISPSNLDEHTFRSYIDRKFKRKHSQMADRRSNEIIEENVPEESIYGVSEKVILIADSAGMGKSTILTKLALSIKKKSPYMWVIRINLDDYTRILKEMIEQIDTISVEKLLNKNNVSKFKNHLEMFLFYMDTRVIMMIDGMDEISPEYTRLVQSLLIQCQQATNLDKLFVTTRPHMIQELEKDLKVSPFILQPFTEEDQVTFLTKFWMSNSQLNLHKEKCERCARMLVRRMSLWTKRYHYKGNSFTALPLQVRMLAEIYQENIGLNELQDWKECNEYSKENRRCRRVPEEMELKKLYDMFIKKKRDVFVYKGTPNAKSTANKALIYFFDRCLAYHGSLAIEVVMSENKCSMFSNYKKLNQDMKMDLLDIGIVQRLDNKLNFVHRTYAEYFFADNLVKELQNQNQNVQFQRFLIEKIFWKPEFNLIRVFFESFLQEHLDSLPPDIFNSYHAYTCNSDVFWWINNHNPIFILAEEGHVAILQLIFKCINFKVVKDKEVNISDIRKHIHGWSHVTNANKHFQNILNALQIVVEQAGINIRNKRGSTPLHCAAERGHLDMVKFLVKNGANINSRNYDGHTSLHLAAWGDHLDTVKFFVEIQADVNVRDNGGSTPLHFAVLRSQFYIVESLLKHNTDVNITDRCGQTALHLAASSNQLDIVEFLVERNIDVNVNNKYGRKALHVAALNGHLNTVKYFVKIYGDIDIKDNDGNTALHLAVLRDHLNTVKFLKEYGAGIEIINNDGNAVLHIAALNGHLDILNYFVKCDVDLHIRSNYGRTALHLAASYGQLNIVRFLAELDNININITDDNGNTALHLAALKGMLDTMKYLTELKVDVNIEDKCGRTALHLAALSGQLDTVKFLVRLDIDINIKDSHNNTALHLASWSGKLDTVKFIVKYGGDFNVIDRYGRTALHLAVLSGKLNTVKYLVKVGVDVGVSDIYGRTAQNLAESTERSNIVKFFADIRGKSQKQ